MSVTQQPRLHRFSLEQCYELGELGLLDKRTELLEGIITDRNLSPPGTPISAILFGAFSMNKPVAGSEYVSSIRLI